MGFPGGASDKNPKYKVGILVVRIAFRIAVELHEIVRTEHGRIDGGGAPALLVFMEHKAIQSQSPASFPQACPRNTTKEQETRF